jgi:hypothetical protein
MAVADVLIVVDAPIETAAVAAPTAVADVPIAGDAPEADLVSNAVLAAAQDTTAVIKEAVPVLLAVRSLFRKCSRPARMSSSRLPRSL